MTGRRTTPGVPFMAGRRVDVVRAPGLFLVRIDSTAAHNRSTLSLPRGGDGGQMVEEVEAALPRAPATRCGSCFCTTIRWPFPRRRGSSAGASGWAFPIALSSHWAASCCAECGARRLGATRPPPRPARNSPRRPRGAAPGPLQRWELDAARRVRLFTMRTESSRAQPAGCGQKGAPAEPQRLKSMVAAPSREVEHVGLALSGRRIEIRRLAGPAEAAGTRSGPARSLTSGTGAALFAASQRLAHLTNPGGSSKAMTKETRQGLDGTTSSSSFRRPRLSGPGPHGAGAWAASLTPTRSPRNSAPKMTPEDIIAAMKRGNERFRKGERKDRNYLRSSAPPPRASTPRRSS